MLTARRTPSAASRTGRWRDSSLPNALSSQRAINQHLPDRGSQLELEPSRAGRGQTGPDEIGSDPDSRRGSGPQVLEQTLSVWLALDRSFQFQPQSWSLQFGTWVIGG